jgi:hypothetical protein
MSALGGEALTTITEELADGGPKRALSGRTQRNLVILLVTLISTAMLWVFPPVGFIACMALLIIVPPWGRTLMERAFISLIVLLGIMAIVVPRGGSTPVTVTSAHIGLAIFVLLLALIRFIPRIDNQSIPRPMRSDWLVAALAVILGIWLMAAYIGRSIIEIVSGLFFTGWDNQGHFNAFANTYESSSSLWPTIDGAVAWNQWYPSLHTTLWSFAQLASQRGTELLDRPGLLFPFVTWTALSFAISLAGLAWVAGDLTKRLSGMRFAAPIAIIAFSAFALFGSPTLLFNAGFINFMMGVSITVVAGYLSARNWQSARRYGWALIPLAALAVNGLLTPLVLGLVPSGVIVLIALWRERKWLAPVWAIASAALVGGTSVMQTRAVVAADQGASTTSFIQDLGAVGVGMVSFNIGMAIAAPIVAIGFAIWMFRSRRSPLAVAVAGPVLGMAVFLTVAVPGALSAGLNPLYSYYVLKSLDSLLLAASPLFAALVGIGIGTLLSGLSRKNSIVAAVAAGVFGVMLFGYVGPTPKEFAPGFSAAPGIAAGAKRIESVNDSLVGEAIINAQQAAVKFPDKTTMLWDGSGTLPNLWVASLHGVMSQTQHGFYKNLPQFPYDESTVSYVKLALNTDPTLNLVVLWFRDVSGLLVEPLQQQYPTRVVTEQVPMRSSPLCLECSL